MPRSFNTTGPCDARWHYMLPPEGRLPDLVPFVEERLYFVLHAARQTGKTTAMRAFAARLRERGVVAVWATLEECQGFEDVERAELLWLSAIERAAQIQLPEALRPAPRAAFRTGEVGQRLYCWLRVWAEATQPTPLVLLLDEADVLRGPALVSFLRQLRAGFMDRPEHFPASVVLIGMRDLRDYVAEAKEGAPVNPGSPFNVKAASLTLRDFTEAEIGQLYSQHTADTGQVFEPDALSRAYAWTRGQPFLVNALARIAVKELAPDGQPITAALIDAAKERLILARTTHLDSLGQRLREPRVAAIVRAVLVSDIPQAIDYGHDDFRYVLDLGLLRRGPQGAEAANPIYREVLGRELSSNIQESVPSPRWRWRTASGGLDMAALVREFLGWWKENAAILEEHADRGYLEAVPQLAFMAFLQRVVNGGGQVHREFAAGRGAIDLLVEYGGERHVVELKRVPPRHRTLEWVREQGVEQLSEYLDTLSVQEGWLLIFDQRADRSWEARLWAEDREVEGKRLHLRGA